MLDNAWGENNNITKGALGGTHWATTFNAGDTHTFTVTLDAENVGDLDLHIVAVDATNNTSGKLGGSFSAVATNNINTTSSKTLTLEVTNDYAAVYLYSTSDGSKKKTYEITSITRTITTASSVDKPTITAPATYDGESTAVTITPGANNHHVKYSVSGSSSDVSNVQITSETTIYITGTSDVTITAVGYNENESESNTNTKTITYSNVVPSGINTVWTGPTSFGDGWGTNVEINGSQFSSLEVGDYIFLKVSTPHGSIPNIGFRNNWSDDCKSYTDTKSGNVAYGNLPEGNDPYWWLKVTDSNLCNLFTNGNQQVQGQNFTLEEVQIRKHVDIGEGANTISKSTDMIVNLGRSFVAGTWNTVCLPFVPTADQANTLFGSGYKLAKFTGVSGTTMQFTTTTIGSFEAGKPYLVLPKTGCATGKTVLFDVDITAKNPTPVTWGNYTFTGTFTTKTFTSADNTTSRFVANENKLKTPKENSTMKALRAYFTVPSTSPARSFTIDGFEDDTTTSISEETMVKGETSPNKIYNLAGQRVAQPTKGLYIVNGKKVVLNK